MPSDSPAPQPLSGSSSLPSLPLPSLHAHIQRLDLAALVSMQILLSKLSQQESLLKPWVETERLSLLIVGKQFRMVIWTQKISLSFQVPRLMGACHS